jgi:hypothetical protein
LPKWSTFSRQLRIFAPLITRPRLSDANPFS